jgi:hypothetical protein
MKPKPDQQKSQTSSIPVGNNKQFKISNLRDVANAPPSDWSLERRRKYFDWAKRVIDQLRGVYPGLEVLFDQAFGAGLI